MVDTIDLDDPDSIIAQFEKTKPSEPAAAGDTQELNIPEKKRLQTVLSKGEGANAEEAVDNRSPQERHEALSASEPPSPNSMDTSQKLDIPSINSYLKNRAS